jgi:hypothetical protein
MSANAYLKAALAGLAVLWVSATMAGPSGAIASAAVAVLVIAVVAAVRRNAGQSRIPVRVPAREARGTQTRRGVLRHSDPDAPGHPRSRAPGRFPPAD